LIWPSTFAGRLSSWNQLRDNAKNLPTESALIEINYWWFRAPWRPYYLHWDDRETWPDPWQLLSDDIYCEVARGLGILYTITLLDRADLAPAELILTEDGHNLVLVSKEKYILNWEPDTIVNTNLEFKIRRQYQQKQIA
jgi:hypothetical protein